MTKKGTHVGFVLSAVIFMSFLAFIFIATEPSIMPEKDKSVSLNHLEKEIIANITADLVSHSINLNSQSNCAIINNVGYMRSAGMDLCNLTIKDKYANILNYKTPTPCNTATSLHISGTNLEFIKIYYSENLNNSFDNSITCSTIQNYEKGQIKTSKQIFFKPIQNLKTEYDSNYSKTKKELNIPDRNDFTFGLKNIHSETIIPLTTTPNSTNIFATHTPIIYIDENASFKSGFLNVKLW